MAILSAPSPAWKLAVAAVCLGVLASLAVEPAAAAHRHRHHIVRQVHRARQQGQIACTVLGCQPIPKACTPVEGRTPGGIPTGFDVIACPPGIWPLR